MRAVSALVLVLMASLTFGCARNAILEVDVIDANTATNRLKVELAEVDADGLCDPAFDAAAALEIDALGTAPPGTSGRVTSFSLVTERPRALCVRLTAFPSSDRVSEGITCEPFRLGPEVLPWFVGSRTRWTARIATDRPPDSPECMLIGEPDVDVCRHVYCDGVEPCDDTSCSRCTDGRHFCEE